MAVLINAKPLAGFDRPLEMLADCHRRVEHFLQVQARVVERYAGRALDDEGRRALAAARDYFAQSAPRHTADEEQSLFPRMQAAGIAEADTGGVVDRLLHDHKTANDLHARIEYRLDEWLAGEHALTDEAWQALRSDLAALQRHYAEHIGLEEQQVFPAAARGLTARQLRDIGNEMRHRRGLS